MGADRIIPFGNWSPDGIGIRAGGSQNIKNVFPELDGYSPIPAPVRSGTGSPEAVISAKNFIVDGDVILYAATADKVYRISGEARTEMGNSFSTDEVDGVGIELFGGNLYTSNINDGLYYAEAITGSLIRNDAAPKFKHLAAHQGFLFGGQVTGFPARLQWSPYNNPMGDWTPDAATQADFNDMDANHGDIRGLTSRHYLSIFQRDAIARGEFVGGAAVFRFRTIEENKGLLATQSLVSTGRMDFFLSEDGFNIWDGVQAVNISKDRVLRWFEGECTEANRYFVKGSVDFRREVVVWTWPESNSYLMYSYRHDKWVEGEYEAGFDKTGLYPISVPSKGIDLDTDAPGEGANLDAVDSLPDSYDHPFWGGGAYQMGFMHAGDVSLFTGSPLEATLETEDFQVRKGRVQHVHELWPIVDVPAGSTLAGSIGSRPYTMGDTLTYSSEATVNAFGLCPVRAGGRFF
jgi:hypothetical protein